MNKLLVIAHKEFCSLFKSIKSIFVILFFAVVSYFIPKFLNQFFGIQSELSNVNETYTSGISLIISIFSFLFILLLSNDILNKELEFQTIRLLVTKVSRISIILGKFLGVLLFWIVCIMISFIIISCFFDKLYLLKFLETIFFLSYPVSICILISVLFRKTTYTIILSIILGFSFPALDLWLDFTENNIVASLKFLLPYFYYESGGLLSCMPVILSMVILYFSLSIFKRRDL